MVNDPILVSLVVTLVENEAESALNAPLISVAICAELESMPGAVGA